MDLYIQPAASFEKSAAEVALPEDANSWPNELLQELYKQVPYIADFDPQVVMDKVDAERGYGFGHVEVQNKTELQGGLPAEAMKQIGIQQVRIPVIIKDRKLMPFDVLITSESKALPLTEGRLRQALFRPQAFDVTGRTPGDMSMVGQLYPPYRQNYGFGGGGMTGQPGMGKEGASKGCCGDCGKDKMKCACGHLKGAYATREQTEKYASGGGELPTQDHFHAKLEKVLGLSPAEVAKLKGQQKTASPAGVPNSPAPMPSTNTVKAMTPNLAKMKTGSILAAILPTIEIKDYVAFTDRFDRGLQAAYTKNAAATGPAVQALLAFDPDQDQWAKTAGALDHLEPSVIQLRKEAEGYTVKQASHLAWSPSTEPIDRGEAVRRFGEKVVLAADLSGAVTLTDGEGVSASPEENRAEQISGFGYYLVKGTGGEELRGFVFPNLYDVDGSPLPIALFTDGQHAAVQEAIAGERLTEQVPELPLGGEPSGHGCFVRVLDGAAEATIPFTVRAGYASGGAQQYQVETYDGRQMMLSVQTGGALKTPQQIDDTAVIPADFQWMPLGEKQDVELVEEPSGFGKQKEAGRGLVSVVVRPGNDNTFSLDSHLLRKIAHEDRSFISLDDTLFYFGGLGTNIDYASEKLAEAIATQSPVTVKVARSLRTMKEALDSAVAQYGEKLAGVAVLRRDLVKEAAFIPDPVAVDTVLSLGFINPENITTFIGFLPQIDQVQAKLCELLIAARLGLQDVPASALEKTVHSLEEALEGLKTVAFTRS